MTTLYFDDLENRYPWSTKEEYYDGDLLTGRLTVYDNGLQLLQVYEGGVLRQTQQSDNPASGGSGIKGWDTITTYFDAAGELEAKVVIADSGVRSTKQFENGVLREFVSEDNPLGGANAMSWDTISRYYDTEGLIEARITEYDNGSRKEEMFVAGVRSHTVQTDGPDGGSKSWDTINTYYDQTGVVEARITQYDNGILNEQFYENGVRTRIVQSDNPEGGDGGVKSWDTIESYYRLDGTIEARIVRQDDGRISETTYSETGKRVEVFEQDGIYGEGGAFDWNTKARVYDENGDLALSVVSYDNGDGLANEYVAGTRFRKLELDADGSEAWVGRVTHFDSEGQVASQDIYLTYEELPEDFGFSYVGY